MDYDWQTTQSRLTDAVRDNPVPLALIGLGLGWLVVSNMRRDDWRGSEYSGAQEGLGYGHPEAASFGARYGAERSYESMELGGEPGIAERAAETGRQWRDKASEMGSRVSQSAQDLASSARERFSSASATARTQASQVADRSLHTFQEHPVMIGTVALLVGAAIGASLPRTRGEDETFGRTRDQMLRQARDSGVVEKAKQVGERAFEAAKESGEQAFERVKGAAKEAASEAYQHVREAARDEAERKDVPGTQGYRH